MQNWFDKYHIFHSSYDVVFDCSGYLELSDLNIF